MCEFNQGNKYLVVYVPITNYERFNLHRYLIRLHNQTFFVLDLRHRRVTENKLKYLDMFDIGCVYLKHVTNHILIKCWVSM